MPWTRLRKSQVFQTSTIWRSRMRMKEQPSKVSGVGLLRGAREHLVVQGGHVALLDFVQDLDAYAAEGIGEVAVELVKAVGSVDLGLPQAVHRPVGGEELVNRGSVQLVPDAAAPLTAQRF